MLRRGPYVVAAGLTESIPNAKPYVLRGRFIDLFNPDLPILHRIEISPGRRFLLLDLDRVPASALPIVVAAACRVREEHANTGTFKFLADGIADTEAVVRIRTQTIPTRVIVSGKSLPHSQYEITENSLRLHFLNSDQPIPVEIRFPPIVMAGGLMTQDRVSHDRVDVFAGPSSERSQSCRHSY